MSSASNRGSRRIKVDVVGFPSPDQRMVTNTEMGDAAKCCQNNWLQVPYQFGWFMSFAENRPQRRQRSPKSGLDEVRSYTGKARRYWALSAPAGAGETFRIGSYGGGLVCSRPLETPMKSHFMRAVLYAPHCSPHQPGPGHWGLTLSRTVGPPERHPSTHASASFLGRHVVRRCCSRRTPLNFNRDKCAANFLGVEIAWHLRKVPPPWGRFSSRDNRLHVLTRQVGDLRYRILVRIAGSGQVTKVRNTRDEPAIMFAVDRCPVQDPVHAFVSLPMSRPLPLTKRERPARSSAERRQQKDQCLQVRRSPTSRSAPG